MKCNSLSSALTRSAKIWARCLGGVLCNISSLKSISLSLRLGSNSGLGSLSSEDGEEDFLFFLGVSNGERVGDGLRLVLGVEDLAIADLVLVGEVAEDGMVDVGSGLIGGDEAVDCEEGKCKHLVEILL